VGTNCKHHAVQRLFANKITISAAYCKATTLFPITSPSMRSPCTEEGAQYPSFDASASNA
jgi:hypothetical protein